MKRILYTALLLNIVILSCKNSAEEAKVDGNNSESIRRLVVDFSFKTDQEDKFRIMMNNIVVDEFQQKNIQFSEDVPPSSSFENFHAEFDAYNMSNNVVINLGNKSLKNVEIESIKVTYGDNEIIASTPVQITEYFALNKFVVLDSTLNILSTKQIDGQHFPAISLKRKSINYLKKE